jgi:hypothetical protein
MAGQGLTMSLTGGDIPQPDNPIFRRGGHGQTVRAERDSLDGVGVSAQRLTARLAAGNIPQSHRFV